MQKEQIFLGMVALKTSARKEANRFIEDVFASGIRFVLFNEESLLHTKIIGDDLGLDIDWNSCISLSSTSPFSAFINSMGMRVLPSGIDQISNHLAEKIDDVPLLVSMFSDSTPESVLEMVKLYQLHGEVVCIVGGVLNSRNMAVYQTADISVGIGLQPCNFCENCYGQKIDYQYKKTISEEIAQAVISTPCQFRLGENASLYRILQVIKEARKLMGNIQLALIFSVSCYIPLTASACISYVLGWPGILSIGKYTFIVYVLIPGLTVSFLGKRSNSELMKLLPIKMSHFSIGESGWFLRNHVVRMTMATVGMVGCQVATLKLYKGELLLGQEWRHVLSHPIEESMEVVHFTFTCLWIFATTPTYFSGFDKVDFSLFHNRLLTITFSILVLLCLFTITGYTLNAPTEMSELLTEIWPEFLIWLVWILIYLLLDLHLKRRERRQYQRIQKTMRLYFQTKLGMHSPK